MKNRRSFALMIFDISSSLPLSLIFELRMVFMRVFFIFLNFKFTFHVQDPVKSPGQHKNKIENKNLWTKCLIRGFEVWIITEGMKSKIEKKKTKLFPNHFVRI